jgi:hypothetical protein
MKGFLRSQTNRLIERISEKWEMIIDENALFTGESIFADARVASLVMDTCATLATRTREAHVHLCVAQVFRMHSWKTNK